MLLASPAFFVFLGVVFLAYWLAARSRMGVLAVVLFANYFFYARWSLLLLAIVPPAALCDFFLARALDRTQAPSWRRLLVAASVLLNVALIASARYIPLLSGIAGSGWKSWTLPLSLSFYGFQAMTYTLDVYRRDAKSTPSLLAYLASVSFFPTTLAGPITRVATLLPQFERKDKALAPRDGGKALFLIGLGLLKKFLVADYLAEHLVNRVFDLPTLYSGTEVLTGVYAYAFQLYYDFSGYTDMATGAALLIGIRLPINFKRPYEAENIADFWRRWHISLSNWLRDYLYFSLPGKRGNAMPYANLIVTFAIGGLWHGASWNFLLWGLLHGTGLAAVRGWQALRGKTKPSPKPIARLARIFVTFHFVLLAWVFFRAPSPAAAWDVLRQIASATVSFVNVAPSFWLVLAIAAVAHYLPQAWYERTLRVYTAAPFYAQAGAMALLALAIQYVAATGAAPFIYSRF